MITPPPPPPPTCLPTSPHPLSSFIVFYFRQFPFNSWSHFALWFILQGLPVRAHYFWPAFCQFRDSKNRDGKLEVGYFSLEFLVCMCCPRKKIKNKNGTSLKFFNWGLGFAVSDGVWTELWEQQIWASTSVKKICWPLTSAVHKSQANHLLVVLEREGDLRFFSGQAVVNFNFRCQMLPWEWQVLSDLCISINCSLAWSFTQLSNLAQKPTRWWTH